MTSTAQAKANRRNAKRSTGPKTIAGKKIVASNALRHGLAVPIGALAEYDPAIAQLTEILAGVGADSERLDLARQVGEAVLDINRARRARVAVLQRPLVKKPPRQRRRSRNNNVKVLLKLAKEVLNSDGDPFWGEQLRAMRREMEFPPKPVGSLPHPSILDENEHFAALIAERSAELQAIDRYERRALSRRKKAIRALDEFGRIEG